jgi:general stress protein YciG
MAGTKAGGYKTRETIKKFYGEDYYKEIGQKGGLAKVPKGFALMSAEQRSEAGRKGGTAKRKHKQ